MASDASINVVASLVAEVTDFVQKFTTDVPAAVQEGMGKVQESVNDATEKVTEGLNNTAEAAGKAGEEVGSSFGEGLMLIMAAVSAAFLDKLHEAFGEAAEMGEQLKNEMAQIGGSAEGVQQLNYAFATFGVSAQEATQSIVMFQRKLDQAAQKGSGKDIFTRAGLDPKAMVGQSASTNIEQIANAMRGLNTTADRSELALSAFGRAGKKLMPILLEGGPAFKELEKSADKAGAVLGGEDVEKLDKLQEKLNQLAVTAKVFAATFIAPIAEAATSIVQHIQDMYAAFEKLSKNDKVAMMFGAIAAATVMAEKGLELIKPLLSGLLGPEVAGSLLAFVGGLLGIVPVLALLGVAWATNFGNMKHVVNEIVASVSVFWGHCKEAFAAIMADAKAVLGPAFGDLSKAVGQLAQDFARFVSTLATSQGFFDALKDTAHALVEGLKAVIEAIVWLAGALKDLEPTLLAIGTAISDVVTKVKDHLGGALVGVGIIAAGVFASQIVGAFASIVGAIQGAVTAFIVLRDLFVSGEIIASIGGIIAALNPVGIAIIAIGVLVVALAANWDTVTESVSGFWRMCVDAFAAIVKWIGSAALATANLFDAIANIIGQIPGLNGIADAARNIGNMFQWAADRAADAYNAISKANAAKSAKPGEMIGWGEGDTSAADDARKAGYGVAGKGDFGSYSAPPPPVTEGGGGGADLGSAAAAKKAKKGPSAGSINTEALDKLKDNLVPYQEALRKTELLLSQLTVEHDKLGKIDTWPKVIAQSAIYARQITATIALEKEQRDLAAQDLRNRAAALALAAKEKDPKEKRKDIQAANAYGVEADAARLKALQDEAKVSALRTAKTAAPIDYEKGVASDSDLPTAVRLAAVNDDILRTLNQEIVSKGALQNRTSELAKLEKTRLDIMAEAAALQTNLVNSQAAMVTAKVNAEQSIRDATPEGAGTQGRAIVNASTDQTNAKADEVAKTRALADAQSQLDEALKKQLASGPAVIALQTAVNLATAAQTTAISASTAAQMKLRQAQEATTPAVLQVRSALLGMAQQVAGPLMNIIKSVNMGVNPLVAIFEELFQKSRSFNDILVTMGKIMDAVAQVFDAMRPVIDLLLGVMIGVVNVFLTMYNVVVKLLDMFGLGIQAVQLVTNSLTGLNNAVPLLQVTHDLPTMNEVNANKMSSLVAQQNNQNNNMAIGFNAGLSKIGEILGTLIGMYALMKMFGSVIGGKGIGATGLIDQVKGLFGGLFSKKTTGAGAQASDFGTWGDAVTNGMTATENSTSDYSGASPTSSDFGTWGTDSVTKGLDKSNMSNFMGNIMHSSAATAIGTSALGALFSGLIGGNKSDAALGGGLGSILSVALKANPLISAGIGVLMPLITGMFGPHYTTDKNPDITNAQINGEAYGQAIANLQGQTVNAGGTAYASQQSTGFLAQISSYIASGGKGLSAALLAEFTGATGIINGKNGILDLSNGVNLQWQQLVNDANTAMAAITAAGGSMANTMQSLLGGATSVNLAALFGNGSSVTAGGYNVMSGGNSNLGNTSASHFTVNIDTVNGTDAASLQTAFQPIFAEYGRQQQIASRTQANSSGRYNF